MQLPPGSRAEPDSASMKIAPENWRVSIGRQGHVAVSPLRAVGGKPTRQHRIRLRSRRSEQLQFPALGGRANFEKTQLY
jgi:hypothetical protein